MHCIKFGSTSNARYNGAPRHCIGIVSVSVYSKKSVSVENDVLGLRLVSMV